MGKTVAAGGLESPASAFDARILGLRGSEELTRRAAAEFRMRYEKVRDPAAPPGSYTVDHSAGMVLLGPDGRMVVRFAYGDLTLPESLHSLDLFQRHVMPALRESVREAAE